VRDRFVAGFLRAKNRCECSGRTQKCARCIGRIVRAGQGLYDGAGQPYSGKETGKKGDPGLRSRNSVAETSGQLIERSVR